MTITMNTETTGKLHNDYDSEKKFTRTIYIQLHLITHKKQTHIKEFISVHRSYTSIVPPFSYICIIKL